jgi:hypothetical protein
MTTTNLPPFVEFPKIPRLLRGCLVTEKIDGTNACVYVPEEVGGEMLFGSRTRWITPENDNFGFAAWGHEHASKLWKLGPGTHYGEWWGKGIQRGYGLDERRFSLFNVHRWGAPEARPACCHVVPVLGKLDKFHSPFIDIALQRLRDYGSKAAPGFMRPEGVVIFHVAGGHLYKVTLENDEAPKTLAETAMCEAAPDASP